MSVSKIIAQHNLKEDCALLICENDARLKLIHRQLAANHGAASRANSPEESNFHHDFARFLWSRKSDLEKQKLTFYQYYNELTIKLSRP